MKKPLTDFTELATPETTNFQKTTKHLGHSALLVHDVESVYAAMTPLIKFPKGDIDTSDEALAVTVICNEFMMCRLLLSKSALAAMRMYQSDSLVHLRRAIESCAFAARMSKHNELSRVFAEGGSDSNCDGPKYKAYRKAFETRDVFPKAKHPDHDPALLVLKDRLDHCSKLIHGSVFGMAGHFATVPKSEARSGIRHVNFFDMPGILSHQRSL